MIYFFDRGFRDTDEKITNQGFQCEMQALLNKTMKQHILEANSSMIITTIRWVVESANSRL